MDYSKKQKQKYNSLNRRLSGYVSLVRTIYEQMNEKASKIVLSTDYTGEEDFPFRFSDYPEIADKVEGLQADFVAELSSIINTGEKREWSNSNSSQDELVGDILTSYGAKGEDLPKDKLDIIYSTNEKVLEAFQKRKDKGLNLSRKLWNQSKVYKKELEDTISVALERGTSAVTLSKQISKYLEDFPKMQKDYTEKFGKASKAEDCEYKSIRLARNEINLAYRNAENARWNEMDFVLGFEVKKSGAHPREDICDKLAGKYPKSFVFKGWHPNCMCYAVPILMSREEFDNWSEGDKVSGTIEDVPQGFKEWVKDNTDRIDEAKKKDTLPYFLKDNEDVYKKIISDNKSAEKEDKIKLSLPKEYSDAFAKAREKSLQEDDVYRQRSNEFKIQFLEEILNDKKNRDYIIQRLAPSEEVFILEIGRANSFQIDLYIDYIKKMELPNPIKEDSIIGHIAKVREDSQLPNDFEKIAKILNSKETIENWYINYGYMGFDETFEELGGIKYIEESLQKQVDNTSVYMSIEGDKLIKKIILGDGKFKNSLETKTGTFTIKAEARKPKESVMFGLPIDGDYDMYPKYGFLAGREEMDYEKIVAFGYGDTYVRFKDDSVRRRTTITCGDSYDGNSITRDGKGFYNIAPATPLQNPDSNFALGMVSKRGGSTEAVKKFFEESDRISEFETKTYIEAQIYGQLHISDVDAIFVESKKIRSELEKSIKKKGLDISIEPLHYDSRLKALEGYGKFSDDITSSLTTDDIDNLGDYYINILARKFANPENGWWKQVQMDDDFMSEMKGIYSGEADISIKRKWLKSYYEEMDKKEDGKFPRVWWGDRDKKLGNWTKDVLDENIELLKRKE